MAKVIIFGAGEWADMAHFYLTHDSPHEVAAFTVDREYLKESEHRGLPLVDFEEVQERYLPENFAMFVPIGFVRMNHLRAEKYHQAKRKGYALVSYVSSKAAVWPGFTCGDNCFILEDNIIQPFAEIGNDVVLWSGSHVGHHTTVEDHVMSAPHVTIAGNCIIRSYSFLGVGATVQNEVVVARETLVGAGVLIGKDTEEFEVYKGPVARPAPVRSDQLAKILSRRTANEAKRASLPESGSATGEKGPRTRTEGEAFPASWPRVDAGPGA